MTEEKKSLAKKSLGGLGKLKISSSFEKKDTVDPEKLLMQAFTLDINLIEEDPFNVRTKYDENSLKDFAETLLECGITSPLSIRPHPEREGMYLLNNGHRRLRAAKIAGFDKVPVTVHKDHTALMQLSDNVAREDLDLLDTAARIAWIANHDDPDIKKTKEQIARALGQKPTWISKVLKLLEMPAPVQFYYELGRLRDLEAIYQLCTQYQTHANEIVKWLEQYKESSELITQAAVKQLFKSLKQPSAAANKPIESKPSAGTVDHIDVNQTKTNESDSFVNETKPLASRNEHTGEEVFNKEIESESSNTSHNCYDTENYEANLANNSDIETNPNLIESAVQGASQTIKDDNPSVLILNMEIYGDTLEESNQLSQALAELINLNFKDKIKIK